MAKPIDVRSFFGPLDLDLGPVKSIMSLAPGLYSMPAVNPMADFAAWQQNTARSLSNAYETDRQNARRDVADMFESDPALTLDQGLPRITQAYLQHGLPAEAAALDRYSYQDDTNDTRKVALALQLANAGMGDAANALFAESGFGGDDDAVDFRKVQKMVKGPGGSVLGYSPATGEVSVLREGRQSGGAKPSYIQMYDTSGNPVWIDKNSASDRELSQMQKLTTKRPSPWDVPAPSSSTTGTKSGGLIDWLYGAVGAQPKPAAETQEPVVVMRRKRGREFPSQREVMGALETLDRAKVR